MNTDVKIQLPVDSDEFNSVKELKLLFDFVYKQTKLYHDLHLNYDIKTEHETYQLPKYFIRFVLNPDTYAKHITDFEDMMNEFESCYKDYVKFKNFMYIYKERCNND